MRFAISFIYFLYGEIRAYELFEYLVAWSWIKASRRFLSLLSTTDRTICSEKLKVMLFDSLVAISLQTLNISSFDGAGMRMLRHLDLIGAISLWIFEQISIILQFFMYISIVLLKAPWASFVSLSASWIIRILKFLAFLDTSKLREEAIYLTMLWIIWVSWC